MPAQNSLLMGITKHGKTQELHSFLDWYTKKTNTVARLITADLGGDDPFQQSGMEEEGRVDILRLNSPEISKQPFNVLTKIYDGFWPDMNGAWKEFWEVGEKKISIVATEGITSIAGLCLEAMKSKETPAGFKKSFTFVEGDSTVSGLNEGHYGIVQDTLAKWLRMSQQLPVEHNIWTAQQTLYESKKTGAAMIVPAGAGSAQNEKIPGWFSNVFHMVKVKDEEGKEVFAQIFESYIDPKTEAQVMCGTRMLPEVREKMLEKFPQGIINRSGKSGLRQYFVNRDGLTKQWKESRKEG